MITNICPKAVIARKVVSGKTALKEVDDKVLGAIAKMTSSRNKFANQTGIYREAMTMDVTIDDERVCIIKKLFLN
jgi:hypothetical protein